MANAELHDEVDDFLKRYPKTMAVDVLIPDSCGQLRGKRFPIQELRSLFRNGTAFPGSIFAMDVTGETIASTGLVWEQGDADMICMPVPGTLQPVPWASYPMAQVMLEMRQADGSPFFASPREQLRRIVKRMNDDGLYPVCAVELEFYLLDGKAAADGKPIPPRSPVSGVRPFGTPVYSIAEIDDFAPVLDDIGDACIEQGLPVSTAVAEYAPGQFEINLNHVDDPVTAADQAILFKRAARSVAAKYGMVSTFMAKPYPDQAGNGMHVHVSLTDRDGNNVFADEDPYGAPPLRWAIGGLARSMREGMAIFAPNANSYRRFQAESYAPNSPTWGFNNRTIALRIPDGPPKSRRVEHRVAGADADPYLVVAAILAGMHYGIKNQIDPGPPVDGNGYEKSAATLPANWPQALDLLEDGHILWKYFDERFRRVYVGQRRGEYDKFFRVVTDLEYEWYLHAP